MLKIAFDPIYKHQLKIGHRFPMEKYELLPENLLRKTFVKAKIFSLHYPLKNNYYYPHTTKNITII